MTGVAIVLRIGLWSNVLHMQFAAEDGPVLRDLGLGGELDCVVDGRTFMFAPLTPSRRKGAGFHHRRGVGLARKRMNMPDEWENYVEFPLDLYDIVGIARFALMELEVDASEDMLSFELPPDHELPWPKRVVGLDLAHELQLRMDSALAAGETRLPAPGRISRLISSEAWAEVVRIAKEKYQ